MKKIIVPRVSKMLFTNSITRFFFPGLLIILVILICRCESKDRFYRPDMPEKLCSLCIIDIDDTTQYMSRFPRFFGNNNSPRFISFENSFQKEYPDEVNVPLRDLSFKISTDKEEIFNYNSNLTLKNLFKFEIPDSIIFVPNEKYYFNAKVNDRPEISAVATVPNPPSGLELISIDREVTTLINPNKCYRLSLNNAFTEVLKVAFNNNKDQKQYYALIMEGKGFNHTDFFPYSGPLDFSVRECNSPGFFAIMYGLYIAHFICTDEGPDQEISPIFAYFIDGSKVPDNKCYVTISSQYHDTFSLLETLGSIRIKLLSIPEELYLFEKTLYTYGKIKNDPFSEPIYLEGNIKGGNGVFAICRSTYLELHPQLY